MLIIVTFHCDNIPLYKKVDMFYKVYHFFSPLSDYGIIIGYYYHYHVSTVLRIRKMYVAWKTLVGSFFILLFKHRILLGFKN